jgi:hypothetical protein
MLPLFLHVISTTLQNYDFSDVNSWMLDYLLLKIATPDIYDEVVLAIVLGL